MVDTINYTFSDYRLRTKVYDPTRRDKTDFIETAGFQRNLD